MYVYDDIIFTNSSLLWEVNTVGGLCASYLPTPLVFNQWVWKMENMTYTKGLETHGRRPGAPEAVNKVYPEWSKDWRQEMQGHYTVSLGLHRLLKTTKRCPKSMRYGEWTNRSLPGPLNSHQETSKRLQKTRWTLDFGETNWVFKGAKSQCETGVMTANLQPKQVSPSIAYLLVDSLKRVSIQGLESYQVSPWGT